MPGAARFEELLAAALPLGLRAGPARRTFHRDLYFDTADGDLGRRGASCVVRFDVEDRRSLALSVPGLAPCASRVAELEPGHMFGGESAPARRLRALVDPARLVLERELAVERWTRSARLPLIAVPQYTLAYDAITARGSGSDPAFHELVAWRRPWAVIPAGRLARAIERRYGLAPATRARAARARSSDAASSPPVRQVALLAVAHGRMALWRSGAALRLALEEGGGEEGCRRAMRRVFGNVEGEVRLLG
ncbi:MAG TPA: hypothetical protein VFI66_01805, partial [Gemmatimonadales bacterium]|nr:hypothetical protein [Gemmatimonadales bacterium]